MSGQSLSRKLKFLFALAVVVLIVALLNIVCTRRALERWQQLKAFQEKQHNAAIELRQLQVQLRALLDSTD